MTSEALGALYYSVTFAGFFSGAEMLNGAETTFTLP